MNRIVLLSALLLLGACASADPYQRPGMWRPSGSNDDNLRAMVAVPSDLVRAAPERGDGQQAAAALDRQRHDKVRPLPQSGVATLTASGASN